MMYQRIPIFYTCNTLKFETIQKRVSNMNTSDIDFVLVVRALVACHYIS